MYNFLFLHNLPTRCPIPVEMVKAKTVDKGKKAPKAKGNRGKGKKAVNAKPVVKTEPVIKNEPVIKEGGVRMKLQRVPKGIRAIFEERGCES